MDTVRKLSLAALLLLSTASCSHGVDCPTPAPGAGSGQIPDCILEKSNQIVISRLGQAFFREHCIQNPGNCAEFVGKPRYRMAYSLSVPDLPGTDLPVAFVVDAAGNLVAEAEIEGLPDCVHDAKECVFTVVDEASAISIARQAGLEPGLGEWKTHFQWYAGEFNTYVWTVDNTLTADESTGHSSGRTVLIDANSGNVLEIFDLQQVP
jgi:hypothetical protein